MADNENVLEIQRALVTAERAKRIAKEEALKRDVRSQIASGGGYNPAGDMANPEYKEYPKFVRKDGKEIIAQNRADENLFLGIRPIPAKVAIVDTGAIEAVAVSAPKRGRPKKQAPVPLPANLE